MKSENTESKKCVYVKRDKLISMRYVFGCGIFAKHTEYTYMCCKKDRILFVSIRNNCIGTKNYYNTIWKISINI